MIAGTTPAASKSWAWFMIVLIWWWPNFRSLMFDSWLEKRCSLFLDFLIPLATSKTVICWGRQINQHRDYGFLPAATQIDKAYTTIQHTEGKFSFLSPNYFFSQISCFWLNQRLLQKYYKYMTNFWAVIAHCGLVWRIRSSNNYWWEFSLGVDMSWKLSVAACHKTLPLHILLMQ